MAAKDSTISTTITYGVILGTVNSVRTYAAPLMIAAQADPMHRALAWPPST